MQRILQPGQIEALAQRSIPRIRLPKRIEVFAARAARLRELAPGNAVGDYLRLLATLVDAQHDALLERVGFDTPAIEPAQIDIAHAHHMPLLAAAGRPREPEWRDVLDRLREHVASQREFPAAVGGISTRIQQMPSAEIEAQADALLASRDGEVDAAIAPFVMAALQVVWVDVATRFNVADVRPLDVAGVCPVCGSLPVASIIRTEQPYQGYRFLHCALCATEWHQVRASCSQCQSTKDIGYHSLQSSSSQNGSPQGDSPQGVSNPDAKLSRDAGGAVRAEACDECRTYRKILYRERDASVEPVADDLASIALDLLMTEAGYHRGSGNPLLWQN